MKSLFSFVIAVAPFIYYGPNIVY